MLEKNVFIEPLSKLAIPDIFLPSANNTTQAKTKNTHNQISVNKSFIVLSTNKEAITISSPTPANMTIIKKKFTTKI